MDDFGRDLGCLLIGLLWAAGLSVLALAVLVSLVLAGVL